MLRLRGALLGGAAIVTVMSATAARADCVSGSSFATRETVCTGEDPDGAVTTGGQALLTVQPGATVLAGPVAAIQDDSPRFSATISGTIDGGARPGLLLSGGGGYTTNNDPFAGAAPVPLIFYQAADINVTVAAGSSVSGANGVLVTRDAGSPPVSVGVRITNSGTITGIAGAAISASLPPIAQRFVPASSLQVTNLAGGRIDGGVVGNISALSNAGEIDGGARSALLAPGGGLSSFSNSGTLTAGGAEATVRFTARLFTGMTNDGLIEARGSGGAVQFDVSGNITNSGTIRASGTAVSAATSLSLLNFGSIVGTVVGGDSATEGDSVNLALPGASVVGDVFLRGGDDYVQAALGADGSLGVSGVIDGGAGIDRLDLEVASGRTIALTRVSNMETLGLRLSGVAPTALTFQPGFTSYNFGFTGAPITLTGTFDGEAQGFSSLISAASGPVTNEGAIRFASAEPFGNRRSVFGSINRATNVGSIDVTGSSAAVFNGGVLTNNGTITVRDGAVVIDFGEIINSSTGTVTLATRDAALSANGGYVTNAGTVTALGTAWQGTRAFFQFARLDNQATGRITGAVLGGDGTDVVINAGLITGQIDLGAGSDRFDNTGGTVVGDIFLGDDNDTLVTDAFATGVTGTVDGGDGFDYVSLLANRSGIVTQLPTLTGFEATTLVIGNGAPVTVINRAALTASATSDAISVSNRATLVNEAAISAVGGTALAVSGTATNAGAITLSAGGIGASVTPGRFINTGTITGDGTGVFASSTTSVENRGVIDVTGPAIDALDNGYGPIAVTNSGTLRSASGPAVRGTAEYFWWYFEPGLFTLENTVGGRIEGAATAIDLTSGPNTRIFNAGTIVGDVLLGDGADSFLSAGGTVAGRIALGDGDDRFVLAAGQTIAEAATGGVDGGMGIDVVVERVTGARTVTLALTPGFEGVGYDLSGGTLTIASGPAPFTGRLALGGAGTVLNGRAIATAGFDAVVVQGGGTGLRFVNGAEIAASADGVGDATAAVRAGTGARIENDGTIRSTGVEDDFGNGFAFGVVLDGQGATFENRGLVAATGGGAALATSSQVAGLQAINRGTLSADAVSYAAILYNDAFLENFGTITGESSAILLGGQSRLVNRGTITGAPAVALTPEAIATVFNEANGTLRGTSGVALDGRGGFGTATFRNAGAVIGDVLLGDGGDLVALLAGHSITGALSLGGGNDTLFLADAAATAIAGAIDPGNGIDTVGITISGVQTVAATVPVAGFERLLVRAGGDSAVTITPGEGAALSLAGQAAFTNASVLTGASGTLIIYAAADVLAARAGLTPLVSGEGSFTNTGTIGITGPGTALLVQSGKVQNNGTLAASGAGATALAVSQASATNGAAPPPAALSSVVNSGIVSATGSATAASIAGGTLVNRGTLAAESGIALQVSSSRNSTTRVLNEGEIRSNGTAVSGNGSGRFTFENAATGTVAAPGGINVSAFNLAGFNTVINRGRITGNVLLGGADAVFVNAGGDVQGAVVLRGDRSVFLTRPDGVQGATGGVSRDCFFSCSDSAYGYFVEESGTVTLPVLAGYDSAALWASGPATRVAIAASPATDGRRLHLFGDGQVVVQSAIAPVSLGSGRAAIDASGASLSVLRIEQDVTAPGIGFFFPDAIVARTARFENAAAITGGFSAVTLLDRLDGGPGIAVRNDGSIVAKDGVGLNASSAGAITLENSGTVEGSFNGATLTNRASGLGVGVVNSGTIRGVEGTALNVDSTGAIRVENAGLIEGTLGGLFANANSNQLSIAAVPFSLSDVTNSGTIRVIGAGTQFSDETGVSVNPAYGVFMGPGRLVNTATGLIEAGASGSVAVRLGSVASITGACDACEGGGQTSTLLNAGAIVGGAGTSYPNAGPSLFNYLPGAVVGRAGIDLVVNTGTITGSIDLARGNDRLENRGTITGDVFLSGGDDRFTAGLASVLTGTADGGDGRDTLAIDTSGANGAFALGSYRNFEVVRVEGSGSASLSGPLPELEVASNLTLTGDSSATSLRLDGGTLTVAPGATLAANVLGGNLSDTLVLLGSLNGTVDLGGGDDRLRLTGSGTFVSASGGEGTDTLELRPGTAGFDLGAQVTGFETLVIGGSVRVNAITQRFATTLVESGATLGGTATGRLVSDLTRVAAGATLATAGAITGRVEVAGTLAPAAGALGTTAVTGDVALLTGSTLLLDVTAAGGDQLRATGGITIASGATLTLAGTRPLAAGANLDLVVADGGITGTFTTINRPSSIPGVLRASANRITLLGLLPTIAGATPDVAAGIAFLNGALSTGQASAALIAALPQLTVGGTPSPAAFARLSPQAFAASRAIAIGNGLLLTDAMRARVATDDARGWRGFAQAFAGEPRLDGAPAAGIAATRGTTRGILGGISGGTESVTVAAFVGRLDSDRSLPALGASTNADGVLAGIAFGADLGPARLRALAAYDGSRASTRRSGPIGDTLTTGRYRVGGWTLDASISAPLSLGESWALSPAIGLTRLDARRDRVIEAGSPFALDVAADGRAILFGDAGATVSATLGASRFSPWLRASVRHVLDGFDEGGASATATLAGTSAAPFTVTGAATARTSAVLGAGFGVDLAPRIRANLSYLGEFGDGARRHAGTAGISIGF